MKVCFSFNLIILFILLCFHSEAQTDQTVVNGAAIENITFPGTQCFYNWVNDKPGIGLAAAGTGNIPSFVAKNTTNTPIIATITATPAVSGMAYITNNYANTVSVIDLATNAVVTTLPVGKDPVGVSVNPVNNQVYISNSFDGSVSVINTLTNQVKATIKVGSYPFSVYVSPDGQHAYVPNFNDNNLSVINTSTNTVDSKWLAGKSPLFITSTPDGNFLYVTNNDLDNNGPGTVTVVNTKTGNTVATITIGLQPWDAISSPDGKFVYVTNSNSSSISVINTNSNTVVYTIPVDYAPRNIALSPDGALLYVRAGYNNKLSIINTATYTTVASVQLVGVGSAGISVSPDSKRVLLVNQLSNTVTVIDAETNKIITNVSVPGDESVGMGNFIIGGSNCTPVTFKITVNPSPNISTNGNLSALSTIYGSPSATTSFSISGKWLTSALTLTAPNGFEISNDNINFSKVLVINGQSGAIDADMVYIRLASTTPVDIYSGNLILTGNNIADISIPIPASEVQPAILTIQADDKSRIYGSVNPILTATYSGFVNNEGTAQLTMLPLITTVADISSPIGKYAITVGNALATNYTFNYVSGVLDITENTGILSIPNTFTPNGDGINDTWDIKNMDTFTAGTVSVFNRYGQQVFFSRGYATLWDGRYNNKYLPTGVYYYLIKTNIKEQVFAGYVTIIR